MQDAIKRILDGEYTMASRSLSFSCTKIDIQVTAGNDHEGSFHIFCEEKGETDGYVYTTDSRMECINFNVSGRDTEISYHFHSQFAHPGEVIKGYFCIVSNHGEYNLPFVVSVTQPILYSSMGPVRNLFTFTNLAKNNWDEAASLFYSPDFSKILEGSDENFSDIYRALCDDGANQQNIEEFLITAGKKQRVEFLYNKRELSVALMAMDFSSNVVEREIEIVRNGWGYTRAEIRCEGDFLFAEKSVIEESDFLGNVCILKVFIDTRLCQNGIHTGKLFVESPFYSLEIPVEIKSKSTTMRVDKRIGRTKRNYMYRIAKDYVNHSLGLISDDEWMKNTGKIAELMAGMDDEDIYAKLFQARILIMDNRPNEAGWLVDQVGDLIERMRRSKKMTDDELAVPICCHWLAAAMVKDEAPLWRQAADKIEAIYKRNKRNWMIGLIALRVPTSYNTGTSNRWNLLEYLFNQGCNSALIYAEAVALINENPSVIRQVDGLALQAIYMGAKNNAFNAAAIEQILYLAGKTREYKKLFYKALVLLFRKNDDRRFLQEICTQLIKGTRKDREAFEWYERAINEDVRLTNLYEYYLFAIDTDKKIEIPKAVLLYFSYQNSLDYEKMAYVYHYMITDRENNPEIYANNYRAMEEFAANQVRKFRINKDLAAVYEEVLRPEIIDNQVAKGMSDILFSYWVSCKNKNCSRVYVYQSGCKKPWRYELKDGCGYIAIYGNGYSIAFEDKFGNRYMDSADYSLEKLMNSGKYMQTVADFVWDNSRFNLYLTGSNQDTMIPVSAENIKRFIQLSESADINPDIKHEIVLKLMEYYYSHEDLRELEKAFALLEVKRLTTDQLGKIFEYLMALERYESILEIIKKYGPTFTDSDNIRRFLEKIITPRADKKEHAPEDAITGAAMYVLKGGNPGSVVATYLEKNYVGMSTDFQAIWKVLVNYDIPRNDLEFRMLSQLLVTGAFIQDKYEIAAEYIKNNPGSRLTRALVAQQSYEYFAAKGKADDRLMDIISKYAGPGAKLPKAVSLAFLKYYAENPDKLTDGLREQVIRFLEEYIVDRVYLGFFKDYLKPGYFTDENQRHKIEHVLEVFNDRTIIDYKSKSGKRARIHYMLTQGGDEQGEYSTEYMRDVCGGICFKDFVVFFGETLRYYITEEDEGQASLSDSGSIAKNDSGAKNSDSKYNVINDMLMSDMLGDYQRFDKLLEEYYRKEFFAGELFKLI